MADTSHTLEITTRVADLASQPLRNVGAAGEQAGQKITRSINQAGDASDRMGGRFRRTGDDASRQIGGKAKQAFTSLALGISSAAVAMDTAASKSIALGANLAAAFATGGPMGLAVSGLSVAFGAVLGGMASAKQRSKDFSDANRAAFTAMADDLSKTRDQSRELDLTLKAAVSGIPRDTLEFFDKLEADAAAATLQLKNAEEYVRKLQDSLAKGIKDERSQQSKNRTVLEGKGLSGLGDQSERMKQQVEETIAREKNAIEILKSKIEEIGTQRKVFDEANAANFTRELNKQLRLLQARNEMEKLTIELEEQRKEVQDKTMNNPGAMKAFDDLAKKSKDDLTKKQKDDYLSILEAMTAMTPKEKVIAEYNKNIRDANGDTLKIKEAVARKEIELMKIGRDQAEAAKAKRDASADYVRNLEEQAAVLNDQTGQLAKQIARVREIEEAYKAAGQAGVEAAQKRQAAEDKANARGTVGQMVGGHMNKGLKENWDKRRAATHERKYRSGGWGPGLGGGFHNQWDEQGNEIQEGQIRNRNDADFNQIDNRVKKKGKPVIIAGDDPTTDRPKGEITPAEDAGKIADAADGAAQAARDAAEAMGRAADASAREKESIDQMSRKATDLKGALEQNATAQEGTNKVVKDLVDTSGAALVKLTNDQKKLADAVKKLVNDLKAVGAIK